MDAEQKRFEIPELAAFSAMAKADELFQIGRYDLAERMVREALVANPNLGFAHSLLAHVLYRQKRFDDARCEAQTALAQSPHDCSALVLLSLLERDAGRYQDAERLLLDALRIEPQDTGLLLTYAELMFRTNRLEKAEKLLRAALTIDPNHEPSHALLTVIQTEQIKSKAAVATGRRGMQLGPDSDVSHAVLGVAYFRHGRPFMARRHLREAVRLDPTDAATLDVYLDVDRACRWTYLPLYYFSLLLDRIPGGQYTVWGILVAGNMLVTGDGWLRDVLLVFALTWVAVCLYSFIATPLTRAWIKFFPAS